jgi:hypothetical protein
MSLWHSAQQIKHSDNSTCFGLFNARDVSEYVTSNDKLLGEQRTEKVSARKWSWPDVKYYPNICLDVPRKTTNLSQDSWSRDEDLNTGPPEYKPRVWPTQQRL